jgi:ammonia channel protein AmtB
MTHVQFKPFAAVPMQKLLVWALLMVTAILMADPAMAQVLAPVQRTSNIIRDTMVAICLAVLTVAWGIAGYKVAFQGADFRSVTGPILGGAMAGSAAIMAALFIQ